MVSLAPGCGCTISRIWPRSPSLLPYARARRAATRGIEPRVRWPVEVADFICDLKGRIARLGEGMPSVAAPSYGVGRFGSPP